MRDGKIIETKINRAISSQVLQQVERERPAISKELELLIRTYSSIQPGQLGTLLIPFKAKEIVYETLTGISQEEIEKIEKQVQHILLSSFEKEEWFENFLDKPLLKGGVELDRRTAERLSRKIFKTVGEIKELQTREKIQNYEARESEIIQIRSFLVKEYSISFKDPRSQPALDSALGKRVQNMIDKRQFELLLDLPPKRGGVGLDRRIARKIARYVELLMLGKYDA